jgi:hypothetical protein
MIYVQATTVCQMKCEHCCVDYGNGKRGKHMSWDTFLGAVHYAEDYSGDHITLGGGEISLHPQFRKMVTHILEQTKLSLFMVTNGGKAINGVSKNIRWLIELMECGIYDSDRIAVELSLDQFHDPVEDGQVLAYFTKYRRSRHGYGTYQMVRNVGDRKLMRGGRALKLDLNDYEWQEELAEAQCICPDHQIYPDGRITGCGCPDSPTIAKIVHHGYDTIIDPNNLPQTEDQCFSSYKIRLKEEWERANSPEALAERCKATTHTPDGIAI